MTRQMRSPGRGLLVTSTAILIALVLSGCGRRGPLEPPEAAGVSPPAQTTVPADPRLRRNRSSAVQGTAPSTALSTSPAALVEDTPEEDESETDMQSVVPSPNPTPRKRNRAYVVPNEPFILDPLL
ncbi:LPS translocon maturation chaperone LptM [Enterovirga sp. CN4-39]|uniref:LPS translocon maturation chaperone LptM n=1 Tax=Enterovirga sp. CN4-39 TaxID=3400910 RepID=UPI003BFCB6E6